MLRWIDTRGDLPPIRLTVLLYIRTRIDGKFEDTICSGWCNYDVKKYDGRDCGFVAEWTVANSDSAWNFSQKHRVGLQEYKTIDFEDDNFQEVTHWTLMPMYDSHTWIDIAKYPIPGFLPALIYMKDTSEDTEDYVLDSHMLRHGKLKNKIKNLKRFRPIAWTLYPNPPKMIDDTFV